MLLARGLGGFMLGAPVQMGPTHQLPGQLPSGSQTASTYDPPSTGYVRGDILYQARQVRQQLVDRRNHVASELKAMYATGQVKSCWDPTLAVDTKCMRNDAGWRSHLTFSTGSTQLCPDESVCRFYDLTSWESQRFLQIPGEDLLNPIGLISGKGLLSTLGVAILPDELRLDNPTLPGELTIEKAYRPTNDQRWLAGYAIYMASQISIAALYDVDISERSNLEQILADNTDAVGLVGLFTRHRQVHHGNVLTKNMSIRYFMNVFKMSNGQSMFTTSLDNFAMNPIRPTPEELDGNEGLYNYYKRGGFLLNKNIAFGLAPVALTDLTYNLIPCMADQCPPGAPNWMQSKPPVMIYQHLASEWRGWWTFVTLTPTDYVIRIQSREPSGFTKAMKAVLAAMAKFTAFLCQIAPLATAINTGVMTKETCVFPDGASCNKGEVKGTAPCKCTPPSDGQLVAAGAATYATQKICGLIQTPPVSVPLPPPEPSPPNYLTWAVVGGVVLGAIWLAKRQ